MRVREVATCLIVDEKTVCGPARKRLVPSLNVGGQWRFLREEADMRIASQTDDSLPG